MLTPLSRMMDAVHIGRDDEETQHPIKLWRPTEAECNIDCTYCFHLHKSDLLGHGQRSRMSEETLKQHIRQYIEAQIGEEVVFSW